MCPSGFDSASSPKASPVDSGTAETAQFGAVSSGVKPASSCYGRRSSPDSQVSSLEPGDSSGEPAVASGERRDPRLLPASTHLSHGLPQVKNWLHQVRPTTLHLKNPMSQVRNCVLNLTNAILNLTKPSLNHVFAGQPRDWQG